MISYNLENNLKVISYLDIERILLDANYCIVYTNYEVFIIKDNKVIVSTKTDKVVDKILDSCNISYPMYICRYHACIASKYHKRRLQGIEAKNYANHIVYINALRHLYNELVSLKLI